MMMLTWMVSVAGMVRRLVYEREIHLEEVRGRLLSENKIYFLKPTDIQNVNFEVLLCTRNPTGFAFACFLWAVGSSSSCQHRFTTLFGHQSSLYANIVTETKSKEQKIHKS